MKRATPLASPVFVVRCTLAADLSAQERYFLALRFALRALRFGAAFLFVALFAPLRLVARLAPLRFVAFFAPLRLVAFLALRLVAFLALRFVVFLAALRLVAFFFAAFRYAAAYFVPFFAD